MDETSELTSMTRNRTIRPLVAAWAFVIVVLVVGFIWLSLSHESDLVAVDTSHDASIPDNIKGHKGSDSGPVDSGPVDSGPVDSEHNEPISHAKEAHNAPEEHPQTHDTPKTPIQDHGQSHNTPQKEAHDQTNPSEQQNPLPDRTALVEAPIDGLFVMGANGPLPVLGPDSRVAWKEYAAKTGSTDDKPMIAIVINGIGLNKKATNLAITQLPQQIDMGFSPYGKNLQNWMNKGRKYGHEAFLMIPTEPLSYPKNDPGPHTLLTGAAVRDNLKKLDWLLSQVSGYVGVINEMGSKFTTSEQDLMPILTDLNQRGLMFLDSRSTQFSIGAKLARQISMPRALNNLYIDNIVNAAEINRNLVQLENTAQTYGSAVGVAQAYPLTITEIEKWTKTLDIRGFKLVPVTAIANRQPIR